MAKIVSREDKSVRLFKNPVLEYFSHIHPATPVVVYVPVILVSLYFGFSGINIINGILGYTGGLLIWTLLEYTIHRWAFHTHPTSEAGKKIHFLVHGVHHDYPNDSTRLVMPLLISAPLAVGFYFLFKVLFGNLYLTFFAGLVTGYVLYDSIHYATHHFKMKKGIFRFLREYHMRHHFQDEKTAFGVSNPLWDYVFGTVPGHIKKK